MFVWCAGLGKGRLIDNVTRLMDLTLMFSGRVSIVWLLIGILVCYLQVWYAVMRRIAQCRPTAMSSLPHNRLLYALLLLSLSNVYITLLMNTLPPRYNSLRRYCVAPLAV